MQKVIKAFDPNKKHIRAGDVFIYKTSTGCEYYGLVVKHKFDLGGFKNCLLLYFFDTTTEDAKIDDLSVKQHTLLFPPTLGGSECWRDGYFSTVGKLEFNDENIYPVHYFKFPQGIRDENLKSIEEPDPNIPIGYAAYPVGLTLLDDIEDCLN
ncbi:hypothetical protein CO614_03480 [Lysobacteraceae bacterium NML120232]|nr:hypothetical protein CO614_03480 [Xanthomonadaceae bacterium NML120232]